MKKTLFVAALAAALFTQAKANVALSSNIDSTGVASAYAQHHFHLAGDAEEGITNCIWRLLLPLKNGQTDTVAVATTPHFTTPAIADVGRYAIKDNAEIVGEVQFAGQQDGLDVTESYTLRLQLKPLIISVDILEMEPNKADDDYFDLTLGITYEGCEYVYTTAEEENAAQYFSHFSHVPHYTEARFDELDAWSCVWVTVTARNDYGVSTQVIEIGPQKDGTAKAELADQAGISRIDIYDLQGRKQGSVSAPEALPAFCKRGNVYVLHIWQNGQLQKKMKYTNR